MYLGQGFVNMVKYGVYAGARQGLL
jgi:hypothetical protein